MSPVVKCRHANVRVTYQHPHGDIDNVTIEQLQATSADSTRPIMTLTNAQCADCGKPLTRSEIRKRSKSGGDLFDPRFRFV